MDRVLSCECGQQHRISTSQAGQEIQCSCGKILPVPTLRGLRELPLAETAPEQPLTAANRGEKRRREWQGWRGITLASAMAGFLIAAACCGWFAFQRAAVSTSYTVAVELEAGEAMLDNFDPNTLAAVWHTFGQIDMRYKRYPDFYLHLLYAAERTQFALIAGAIAAGFAAIAFAIWITTPKKTAAV